MNKRLRVVRRTIFLILMVSIVIVCILKISIWNSNEQANNKNLGVIKETFKVVIDPGHGGIDPGAIGTSGLYEKDFTLSLAKKVSEILGKERNVQVYMTNQDVDFTHRPNFANEIDADLYISIHGNTFESSDVSGTESYYYNKKSKPFAEIMHKYIVNATGFNDRGVRRKDLFVVRYTDMPSVLLEVGYLTNSKEEQLMGDDEFQVSIAQSICDGVKEYLKTS